MKTTLVMTAPATNISNRRAWTIHQALFRMHEYCVGGPRADSPTTGVDCRSNDFRVAISLCAKVFRLWHDLPDMSREKKASIPFKSCDGSERGSQPAGADCRSRALLSAVSFGAGALKLVPLAVVPGEDVPCDSKAFKWRLCSDAKRTRGTFSLLNSENSPRPCSAVVPTELSASPLAPSESSDRLRPSDASCNKALSLQKSTSMCLCRALLRRSSSRSFKCSARAGVRLLWPDALPLALCCSIHSLPTMFGVMARQRPLGKYRFKSEQEDSRG
mmetsp:Transcript_62648/g.174603  ORF Transcript_62648/g.174603 Transcript_62648/m.174603 type:complete len:274 (+) Transcript_62648:470-1291(+)